MKKLIWLAVVLAFAVWIGTNVKSDPGIMIVRVAGWRVDMPLWLAVVAAFFAFVLFHYMLKIYDNLVHSSFWVGDFTLNRKKQKARRLTHQGFIELAEGDWIRAEKHFLQAAEYSEVPLLNYLSAAKAAQELGEAKRRDRYLKLAHDKTKGADIAIGLTQARLQYQQGQFEQSLATAKHLLNLAPFHPHILKLLKNIYQQLKDWEQLLELLPNLRKHKVISSEEEKTLEKQLYVHIINSYQKQSEKALDIFWHKIPKRLQTDPDIVYPYALQLCQEEKWLEAESVLRQCLKKIWSESCIYLYGLIKFQDPQKPLDQAEAWLRVNQDSPNLLLTLGRLCMQAQLWGKAQRYLEACLKLSALPEAYAELGILLEKVDQLELSNQYFRKGLIQFVPIELTSVATHVKFPEKI